MKLFPYWKIGGIAVLLLMVVWGGVFIVSSSHKQVEQKQEELQLIDTSEPSLSSGGDIEMYRIKAREAEFKSQVNNGFTNLLKACDEKGHLNVSDMLDRTNRRGEKMSFSYINRESFRVLSENCGSDGQWKFEVEVRGRDEMKDHWALCEAPIGCGFDGEPYGPAGME